MIFTEISVENYRCFEEETVAFDEGVNVIYGLNGTGKSTLLEACFFALYGSDALRETDSNLEDVITNGQGTTKVELRFVQDDNKYRVVREIRERSGRVTQAVCELETPDETLSGATDVDSEIERMIRMDATSFLNCAYIRQGEIEKLIRAKPSERQDLIDNLLQLGKLEEYKTRASDIRVGIGRVRDKKRNLEQDRKEAISKREEKKLNEKLETLNKSISNLESSVADYESKKDDLQQEKLDCREVVNEQEEMYAELQETTEKIETHESNIEEITGKIQELESRISAKKEQLAQGEKLLEEIVDNVEISVSIDVSRPVDELKEEKSALNEVPLTIKNRITEEQNTKENARSEKERLENEVSDANELIQEKEREIEEIESKLSTTLKPEKEKLESSVRDCISRVEELGRELRKAGVTEESLREEKQSLETKREEIVEQRASLSADKKAAEKELSRATELKEKGKCPECGQDVCDSPEVKRIDEVKKSIESYTSEYNEYGEEVKRIDERLEEIEQLESAIDEMRDVSRELQNKKELLEKQLEAIEAAEQKKMVCVDAIQGAEDKIVDEKKQIESIVEVIDDAENTIEELRERKKRAEKRLSVVSEVVKKKEEMRELESEISSDETTVSHKAELREEKKTYVNDLITEKNRLDDKVDVDRMKKAEDKIEQLTNEIRSVKEKIQDVESELSQKQQRKGELQNEVEQLNNLRAEKNRFKMEVESLEKVYSQMELIEEMYVQLRGDLRQENVHQLEKSLNELFDIAYQNDSYDRIELDGEYNASVIEKTSGELDPKKLSGGEKALFNLSLRCAIYQLLVEGLGGEALMPPLILDEPTVHLDEGHIGKIDDIVRRMRDIGVEQSIVVSHDEEIIDSSNHRINVEQQGSGNRSVATVESELFI